MSREMGRTALQFLIRNPQPIQIDKSLTMLQAGLGWLTKGVSDSFVLRSGQEWIKIDFY